MLKQCLKPILWGMALSSNHFLLLLWMLTIMLVSSCLRISTLSFHCNVNTECGSYNKKNVVHFGTEYEFSRLLCFIVLFFSILYLFLHFCQELRFKMKTGFHVPLSTLHSSPWIARIKDNFSLMPHTVTRISKSCPIKRHTLPGSGVYWSYCINSNIV